MNIVEYSEKCIKKYLENIKLYYRSKKNLVHL